ncbi:unnamed protein product, partial [Timema podura]|nr:unnamed protein product [Timema podura]
KPLACNIREGKWILVFINGDTYNEGTWVLVNPTHIRNFAKLLAHLTDKLNPIFGAVRSLVALRDGWPITVNSLDSIRPNEKYVAIGSEKFKPLRYLTKQEKEHKSFRKVHYNVGEQYCQLSVRCKKDTHISIYLFTNGDRSLQPYKFVLTQNNLASWGSTLELMARRMTASPR